jgi:hypothetical protein
MRKCRETTRLKAELASSKEKNAHQTKEKKDRQEEYVQYISGCLIEYLQSGERANGFRNAIVAIVKIVYNDNENLTSEKKIEEIKKSFISYQQESEQTSHIIDAFAEIIKILDRKCPVEDDDSQTNVNMFKKEILTAMFKSLGMKSSLSFINP